MSYYIDTCTTNEYEEARERILLEKDPSMKSTYTMPKIQFKPSKQILRTMIKALILSDKGDELDTFALMFGLLAHPE